MDDSRQFIELHHTLMQLCHNPDFIANTRHDKLRALTRLCSHLMPVERVSVWSLDTTSSELECEVLFTSGQGHDDSPTRLESHLNPAYFDALLEARVIDAGDARQDNRTQAFTADYLSPIGIQSMLDAPIFDAGRLSGVVCLEALEPREWTLSDISLATAIADTISLINTYEAWCQSQQQLDYITHFDDLTGLSNLNSIRERLNRLTSSHAPFAVFWIDLDRLKTINDGMGQQLGDRIIAEVASRLRALPLPGKDSLARAGGDEFIMLIRARIEVEELNQTANRLLNCINEAIEIQGQQISVSACIGIGLWPAHGDDPARLLEHSEAAMYHAKQNGLGQIQFFNRLISSDARSRFMLESQLRHAIDQQELDIHYQPIVRASDGVIVQLEALVRWHHSTQGMLPPIRFLELARTAGLMADLGNALMHRLCQQIRQAEQAGIPLPRIAVNLAPEQLLDAQLPEQLKTIYEHYDLDGAHFDFELTEDAITGDSETLKSVLGRLVELGARLSIDDFGTGYSSLSRLKQMPFSKLKIDRSFIQDMPGDTDDDAIIRSILGLAKGLGLAVVAEGIETAEQEEWLKQQGCDYLQGYRFGRPAPLGALYETLRVRSAVTPLASTSHASHI